MISWLWRWLLRHLRTILSLALLLTFAYSIATQFGSLLRGLTANTLVPVAVIGVLASWLLAILRFPGWLAGLIFLTAGPIGVLLQIGQLGSLLRKFLSTLLPLFVQWVNWHWDGRPDVAPTVMTWSEFSEKSNIVLTRLWNWLHNFLVGKGGFDPVGVALFWGLLIWLVMVWAGWAVFRRRQPVIGLAPGIIWLAVTLDYVGGGVGSMAVVFGLALLLLALLHYLNKENYWTLNRIDYAEDLPIDMAIAIVPLVIGFTTLAYFSPSVSLKSFNRFFQHIRGGTTLIADRPSAEFLGLQPQPKPGRAFDQMISPGLPLEFLLGSGPELSERVVMYVETYDLAPMPEYVYLQLQSASTIQLPTYYWRALTYDYYTSHGWSTTSYQTLDYGAKRPVYPFDPPFYSVFEHDVQIVGEWDGLLYAGGFLKSVDQDYKVAWRVEPTDIGGFGTADAYAVTTLGRDYHVTVLRPVYTIERLRLASNAYPDWVTDHYLQLPEGLPTRVVNLARALTDSAPTSYDKAIAIESYLRATYPYTLNVSLPPPTADVADYFLFDLRKGFCSYYATAMVVMARTIGIPARMVIGYSSGNYDPENALYVVTEANAHAWVEVYFPEYGWITFEPTAGTPAVDRPSDPYDSQYPLPTPSPDLVKPSSPLKPLVRWIQRNIPNSLQMLSLCLVGILLLFVIWRGVDNWLFFHLPLPKAMRRLYRRLYRQGRRLARPVWAGETPFEFAASLQSRLEVLSQKRFFGPTFTPAIAEVQFLTNLYARALYSDQSLKLVERHQAVRVWKRLRRRLWVARWYPTRKERL
jgi:transglutaminase-like putative cysteine protease